MAEHTRHRLARDGFPLRPQSILTLGQLVDFLTRLGEAPAPLRTFLVEQALERLRLPQWTAVESLQGFHRAIAELVEEAPREGLPGDWGRLLREVDRGLEARGVARRNVRLAAAASYAGAPLCPHLVFDGFFSFSRGELELILALAQQTPVTVTLPESPGASGAIEILETGLGQILRIGDEGPRKPDVQLFSATTVEQETSAIAEVILSEAQTGRPFREIGIVLRTREPYASILETMLARHGIPARFYFSDPLDSHPVVAFLSGIMRSNLRGWDREILLSALRMPVSGLGATAEGDSLDFKWRADLPAFGLPSGDHPIFVQLAQLDRLRSQTLHPSEWRRTVAQALLPAAPALVPSPPALREQVQAARSTSLALAAFDKALEAAAIAIGESSRMGLATFWREVERVLALEPLRVTDRRRDVVHVMDVFEARQWELPVVFVCGLTERHFPQYHREDPLLGDAERRRVGLDTAVDRQDQERFLFDLACTRATESLVLSYPRFDEKGEETIPSFFLPSDVECGSDLPFRAGRLRHAEAADQGVARGPGGPPHLASAEARELLAARHRTLSPSSLGNFLQCPFQFFAGKTLDLRERPPAPRDRLDYRLQGKIIHRALAEYGGAPLLGAAIFEQVFKDECDKAGVPQTYRTEAVRVEMLRNFERFISDRTVNLANWQLQTEQSFRFSLPGGPAIRGRIDLLQTDARGRALVIDYKYSAAGRIRDQVEESAEGNQLQAGLYLTAAERSWGLVPAGMLFCGLKKEVRWDGWHTAIAGLEPVGMSCTADYLRDLVRAAENAAIQANESILTGRIEPAPADRAKCPRCDFRDICRVESMAVVSILTAEGQ